MHLPQVLLYLIMPIKRLASNNGPIILDNASLTTAAASNWAPIGRQIVDAFNIALKVCRAFVAGGVS